MAGGAYVVIALSFGLSAGIVGKIKGSSFFIWFIIGAVVPLIGLLTAIAYRSERDELRRRCPTCGRVCKDFRRLSHSGSPGSADLRGEAVVAHPRLSVDPG
jgi:hypothetical protein